MGLKFRVDDFPLTKPEEGWRHNLDSFKSFHAVMSKHGIWYTLGVIPHHVTHEQLLWLSTQPELEVALHGIDHDERFPNEFRDHQTQADIENSIRSVKELWDPRVGPVTSYIPPHNVIDTKTIRALKNTGFTDIFGGPGTDIHMLEYAEGMDFRTHLSTEQNLYGRSDELFDRGVCLPYCRSVIEQDTSDAYGNPLCLAFHWTWEINIGLSNLDKFLTELLK